jgi:hypothetical protein
MFGWPVTANHTQASGDGQLLNDNRDSMQQFEVI